MHILTLFSLESGINKLNHSDVMFSQLQQLADQLEQIQPIVKLEA